MSEADDFSPEVFAGCLESGIDPVTSYVASLPDSQPARKDSFGAFLFWLFLGALATMLFVGWLAS